MLGYFFHFPVTSSLYLNKLSALWSKHLQALWALLTCREMKCAETFKTSGV